MKILILSWNQWKKHNRRHEFFKQEITRQHEVCFYGPGYFRSFQARKIYHISDIIDVLDFKPDVILTYLAKHNATVQGLANCGIPKVHYIADYCPIYKDGKRILWIGRDEDPFIEANKPDLVLVPNHSQKEELEEQHPNTNIEVLPFSINTDIFQSVSQKRDIDISCSMCTDPRYYTMRQDLHDTVAKMPKGYAFGGHGKRRPQLPVHDYVDVMARSKISLNTNILKYGDHCFVNPRFFEVAACGSLLMTTPADSEEWLGFVEGHNYETFESIVEMEGKVKWYLDNPNDLERVASNGRELIEERHTDKIRIQELTELIGYYCGLP
jgi:glycosyltransferase involved in cell wall biosynthesis